MRDLTESTTRKRQTWQSLTPRSATQTGDVVDVWDHDDDRWYRGVYLGFCDCMGSAHAEIEDIDDKHVFWFWAPGECVTIRLVGESLSIPLHVAEDRLDARDAKPLTFGERVLLSLLMALVCGMFFTSLYICCFGR